MRITNSIITNNTIRNVNTNKGLLDNLYTQLATGKKIQRASENPIIAIRALRFRSELGELDQYLKKNIPDARSWMELTEDALTSVDSMAKDMVTMMNKGSNGPMDTKSKQEIIKTLTEYRSQINEEANASYSGRSIFTGYKTNSTMTFYSQDKTIQYDIKETFTPEDLDKVSKIANSVDASQISNVPDSEMPERYQTYRLRLAYEKLEGGKPESGAGNVPQIKYTKKDQTTGSINVTPVVCENGEYYEAAYNATSKKYESTGTKINPYKVTGGDTSNSNCAYFIAETGEIVMNEHTYKELREVESMSVEYRKIGFEKGDLRPENYFECTCTTSDGVKKKIDYSGERQDINYTVNFNQTMKINTEGKDIFRHDIVRDIDELVDITQTVLNLEEKRDKLKQMSENSDYADKKAEISSMLAAAEKELDYAQDTLESMYGKAITTFTEYQNLVDGEIADVGARCTRLSLNETRLENQRISLEDLKSVNEDADEAETIINLTTAHNIYEASLSAASKLISTSLLDYI